MINPSSFFLPSLFFHSWARIEQRNKALSSHTWNCKKHISDDNTGNSQIYWIAVRAVAGLCPAPSNNTLSTTGPETLQVNGGTQTAVWKIFWTLLSIFIIGWVDGTIVPFFPCAQNICNVGGHIIISVRLSYTNITAPSFHISPLELESGCRRRYRWHTQSFSWFSSRQRR